MSRSVHVVWDDTLTTYDFGPGHPLAPVRVELAMRLARELGLLDLPQVSVTAPADVPDEVLHQVHAPDYVDAVRRVGASPHRPEPAYGLGTDDNPAFAGMHEASLHVVGASLAAARAVWSGAAEHAVNIAGGLHHAMAAGASGFCVYNDPAVAIADLLAAGAARVAYVDIDVHHGDGVQAVFWDEPRVLTVSLHETGRTLFPGTGYPYEVGGPAARGSAVNVALPPGTGDEGWLRAFRCVVPHLLSEFAPDVLVTQHGCDSHFLDPLAHLALSLDGQRTSYSMLHDLAHQHAGGRWLALGGGGYEIIDVVPRAWSHLIAIVAGRPVDPATDVPAAWRAYVQQRFGHTPPARMTDGRQPVVKDWTSGYDPADPVDQAILATRQATYPLHGLDPLLDV